MSATLELFKQTKPRKGNSITADYPRQEYQIDLMDMQKIKNKPENKRFAWGLVVIDIYSRYLWVIPLKTKSGQDTMEAFKKVNPKPEKVVSDSGKEFLNSTFQGYLKQQNIKHYTVDVGDHRSLGVVDRVIRTIRRKLRLHWSENDTFEWIKTISDIVANYNNRIHSTTKNTPRSVFTGRRKNLQKIRRDPLIKKYTPGTKVRKLLKRNLFEKGGKQWSREIFTVQKREGFKLILNDGSRMPPHELLITNFTPSGDKKEESLKDKVKKLTKEKRQKEYLKRVLDFDLDKEEAKLNRKTSKRTRKKVIRYS